MRATRIDRPPQPDRAPGRRGRCGPLFLVAVLGGASLTLASLSAPAAAQVVTSTAPSGSAGSPCTAGQTCTYPDPIFACDYASAERIAAAGPAAGRDLGLTLVHARSCQIAPAGLPVKAEATQSARVLYLTNAGKHLGYLPVDVFAPAGSATLTSCQDVAFCAVRSGAPAWACPKPGALTLPTTEAKGGAGCITVEAGNTGEVVQGASDVEPIGILFGSGTDYRPSYFVARADLSAVAIPSRPTPFDRGWCKPGDTCVTSAPALFCPDRATEERLLALPAGEASRTEVLMEAGCRRLLRGNPLTPAELPAAGGPARLVPVTHPVLKKGWVSADAFGAVALAPPLRYTRRLADLTVLNLKGPNLAAVRLAGQGTREAVGDFQVTRQEQIAFCQRLQDAGTRVDLEICAAQAPATTRRFAADCGRRLLSFGGGRYQLVEKVDQGPPDQDLDPDHHWAFRDLGYGSDLTATAPIFEPLESAFNALCPGADPEVSSSLAYRDPQAAFPRELAGRWFDDRRACRDPGRNGEDYDEHAVMVIAPAGRTGNREFEFPERANAVRRVGPGSWQIDSSHTVDGLDPPEILSTATYMLTRDELTLTREGAASKWVRCR
ncbi:hypothetical protein [Lichenibacterium dinghuense]|uniref:hypothetical protein n=1 Tax=Lichenibacterium dinghuense TaxID=2895977 RepID=UPI001F19706F|nr:hypothetical protein [Lichenibacterium sp. 6Y81]